MKNTYSLIICAALSALSSGSVFSAEKAVNPVPGKEPSAEIQVEKDKKTASIQLAILLDTSSSMDGLINQARTYLWQIVNEMTLARQNGRLPHIQIALYEYGNTNLPQKDDYIRQVIPLTDDLDAVSEALFKLQTCGGDEYCGSVIRRAVGELAWEEKDAEALKMIFIAGNESFDQGSVPYRTAIGEALAKGITVNTVLCGRFEEDRPGWREGAVKGDGNFTEIDQDKKEILPETPQDKALGELNTRLNGTYLAYGKNREGKEKLSRQLEQDKQNAEVSEEAFWGRVKAKASREAYKNTSWDLVDAFESDQPLPLEDLQKSNGLPEEFKGKSIEEMKTLIEKQSKERKGIQVKIHKLSNERDVWLKEWRKSQKNSGNEKGLNEAIIGALKKQAARKNFDFPKENSK